MRSVVKRAIYAGTFDPPTNGHLYLVNEASGLFDELVVAIGINSDKIHTYSVEDRIEMLKNITLDFSNVSIHTFENMYLVEYAHLINAKYILRGVRSVSDYEYERNIRYVNSDIHPDISTLFIFPPREYLEISSSLVKGLLGFNNWQNVIKKYVPEPVRQIMLRIANVNESI